MSVIKLGRDLGKLRQKVLELEEEINQLKARLQPAELNKPAEVEKKRGPGRPRKETLSLGDVERGATSSN